MPALSSSIRRPGEADSTLDMCALVKRNGGSMVKVGCDMRDTGLQFSYMMDSGPPALPCLNTQLGVEMSVNQMGKINCAKVGNRAEKKEVDFQSRGAGSLA
ncbi:hypothetical protein HispidOSU_021377 [Sigmodon hispidus]